MLAAVMWLASSSPASAQELGDYFQISYDPAVFDKTEVTAGEAFQVVITGRAVCEKDLEWKGLPLPVTKAVIISQVIARHTESGATVVLNPEYIVVIDPFPDREGDTIEITQIVPLKFTTGATSGNYTVIGQIVEAKVKFFLGSIDVTGHLPQEQPMGTVKYTAPETTPSPEMATEEASSSPAPASEPEPTSSATIAPPATIPEPEQIIPWWVGLVVFAAIAVTVLNVAWFISQWLKKR